MRRKAVTAYKTILATPPWPDRVGRNKAPQFHYPRIPVAEIMALRVEDLCDPMGAHLYLCTPNSWLSVAMDVVRAWNFRYVSIITWAKMTARAADLFCPESRGFGQYFRSNTEHVLFAVRGKLPYRLDITRDPPRRMQGSTLITAPRFRYPYKPPELIEMCERVSFPPRLEMWAPRERDGWDVWGPAVDDGGVTIKSMLYEDENGNEAPLAPLEDAPEPTPGRRKDSWE